MFFWQQQRETMQTLQAFIKLQNRKFVQAQVKKKT
jgi:hypothetical protein